MSRQPGSHKVAPWEYVWHAATTVFLLAVGVLLFLLGLVVELWRWTTGSKRR
jgi:hypothetical protein